MHESMHQQAKCAYNSPVSGLCSDRSNASGAAGAGQPSCHAVSSRQSRLNAAFFSGSLTSQPQPQPYHSLSPRAAAAGPLCWMPLGHNKSLTSSTRSMPELWQEAQHPAAVQHQCMQQPQPQPQQPADRQQLRDQHQGARLAEQPPAAPAAASAGPLDSAREQQHLQQQPTPPLEVLLSPLLPSADETKLAERLSQLRATLDEQCNLAAGWEQQASALQQALVDSQQEGLCLRGQLVAAQQHIALLGGNLQGRLSLAQGAVLAQMQGQLETKDAALAAGQQQLSAIQAEVERLSCSFSAKLAAEQTERERLAAEASQARLLCMARGRQATSLQQELEQLQQAASQQQDSAAAAAGLQQQQLEDLHHRLQQLQAEVAAAQASASAAEQKVAASEGGKAALRQQVEELQGLLAEKQLQVEWLEGKVADLEGSDLHQQFKRHSSDVTRIQAAAASDRHALEQQLSAVQRQLAQLQQQEDGQQQQLLQQRDSLEQKLHESQQAHQEAVEQVQLLAQQLQRADEELQQLQEELQAAREDAAAAEQQQQQQQQAMDGAAGACDGEAGGAAGSASAADASEAGEAELHALRAQLGIAKAEASRLRHELDVASASRTQERSLTGQEIMRLQHELTEAAAAASSSMSGSRGMGSRSRRTGVVAGEASDEAGEAGEEEHEVTSGAAGQAGGGLQAQSGCSGDEDVLADLGQADGGDEAWAAVHYNPAFEAPGCPAAPAPGKWQQSSKADAASAGAAGADAEEQQLLSPAAKAAGAGRYEARLQDQADTIASLQQQLKQQQQLLAALQRRERRVYDSAASQSSWVEVLGLDQQQQHEEAPAAAAAAAAHVAVAAAPAVADAAVQTEGLETESAGSTAAPPAAGYEMSSPAAAGAAAAHGGNHHHSHHHHHQQQQHEIGACGDMVGDVAAGNALLAAARHEIMRLQELNQQLLLTHAEEIRSSVSFEDARRAVAEAKQHAKAKAAAVLKEHSRVWADKLAAVRAQRQQLQQQVQQLQEQGHELAVQAASCARCAAAEHLVQQLQQQLDAAQQQVQQLRGQIAVLADSHNRELEQVRMELEEDAAAAMLDAAAASAAAGASVREQQQHHEQAVQVDLWQPAAGSLVDAAVQTDLQQLSAAGEGDSRPAETREQQQQKMREALADACCGTESATAADERPCTPQPAAVSSAAGAAASGAAAEPAAASTSPAAGAAAGAAAAEPAAAAGVHSFVRPWHAVATVASAAAADAGDDDLCRMSSASDTPASIASKPPGSSSHLADLCPPAAAAASCCPTAGHAAAAAAASSPGVVAAGGSDVDAAGPFFVDAGGVGVASTAMSRPDTAGTNGGLPELTESTSPVAAASYNKLLPPGDSQWRPLQQQQQQQPLPATQQPVQQQPVQRPQQQGAVAAEPENVAQLSEWHVELLQQQAQLNLLKVRLSQHQQAHGSSPFSQRQQHQQPRMHAGNRYSAASTPAGAAFQAPLSSLAGPGARNQAAAVSEGGRPAVLGSPAGPVVSSSSPLTFQQRRLQQQQQHLQQQQQEPSSSSRAGTWELSRCLQSFDSPSHDALTRPVVASPTVAGLKSSASCHVPYGNALQASCVGQTAAAFATSSSQWCPQSGGNSLHAQDSVTGVRLWGASGRDAVTMQAAAGQPLQLAGLAAGQQQQQWQQAYQPGSMPGLMPNAGSCSTTGSSSSLQHSTAGVTSVTAAGCSSALRSSSSALQASGSGLVQLGADVLGALSLSRIHKERSKLQEARAQQHALMAAHHESQAAVLRSSRLSGSSDRPAAAANVVRST